MSANDKVSHGNGSADSDRSAIRDGLDGARSQVSDALVTARDGARDVIDNARSTVGDPGSAVDARPLTTVLGGIALGALVGSLLPRSEKETQVFGALGRRLHEGARDAAGAAKQAGQQKFAALGLDRDHAQDTARGFVEEIIGAAASAGSAAFASSARKDQTVA